MSQTVDSRIVEMRFDNKQFEAGAKETMGTLDKLKEALKLPETSKALEGIDKATKDIKLDGIASGIEALERRFSTLGIVGMRVIENITDGLMNKLNAAVNFVTNSIVSGGIKRAMNIENAHFQLQALLKDETKVQAVMADAMESVDGTAYAYDEAAKAASQFAASGIQAGDDMLNALKGITGVAAMTNSEFENISRIFTTVAGNGRLMGDQLLQLSSRGLNAASTLADYFKEVRGQSNMTEGEIREMVSKGKISFKDFSDAMTWAFGDSAKRANETFTGSMSNMKSALARIGAAFISPLVEQNGELVQLFNALRIKINDVKSALTFDEQRSAVQGLTKDSSLYLDTVSAIVKNGSVGFDEITKAILGTSKSEEELVEINEKLSTAYDEVKESGSATNQTLIDFNENGINASRALRNYINGVLDGTIKVSDGAKKAIEDLTEGAQIGFGDITRLAEEGKISYDIFTDAIVHSSDIINSETKYTSDAIKKMMNDVKKNGTVTSEALVEFNKQGMNGAIALRQYMNGVLDGSIRATYATKQSIEEITQGTEVAFGDIVKYAEEGKITYDIFQSAMENFYGEEKTLSKQFTDTFLDLIKKISTAVNELDVTKPMTIFYFWFESLKNILKGVYSFIRPVTRAFANLFPAIQIDRVIEFSEALENLTAKFRLSEKGSENLQTAFEGIFSVLKLGVDVFLKLLGVVVPINKPVNELGEGILELAAGLGRLLTKMTETIRSSEFLRSNFNKVSGAFAWVAERITDLIKKGRDFVIQFAQMEGTVKLVNAIKDAFKKLWENARPNLEAFIDKLGEWGAALFNLDSVNAEGILGSISDAFSKLADKIQSFSFDTVGDAFDKLRKKIEDFKGLFTSNDGLMTFVKNAKQFGEDLREAFTWDNLMDRLEKIMDVFGKFFKWIKETFGPAFEDFSIGGAVGTVGGFSIIYAFIKAVKVFKPVADLGTKLSNVLGSISSTLAAYQKDLKASAILKIAAAIGILAVSITLLSFADVDRAWQAAIMIGLIGSLLVAAVGYFTNALKKTKTIDDVANTFAKALNNLTKALKWKQIGSTFLKLAASVLIVAGSIAALGLLYTKNKEAFKYGSIAVGVIGGILILITAIFAGLGKKLDSGMDNLAKVATSISILFGSMTIIVAALNKLFKITLPDDWQTKLSIIGMLMLGVGALGILLGIAGRIAGGGNAKGTSAINLPGKLSWMNSFFKQSNGGSLKSGPILAMAASVYVIVSALNKLFNMDLPDDYIAKTTILGVLMLAFGGLMVVIGYASKQAGGAIKATGTILAMTAFLVVLVGSLFVLTTIPIEKMLSGAVSLGLVLVGLAAALSGAGKITDKNTYVSVLAMTLAVATITASLSVLSMVPWDKMLTAAVAIGAVLLTMGGALMSAAEITDMKQIIAIGEMIAAVGVIAFALTKLSEHPWENILASSASISLVMAAMSIALAIMGNTNIKIETIATFVAAAIALIPIGYALTMLAGNSWDSILPAMTALSAVSVVLAAALIIMSNVGPGVLTGTLAFVAGAVALIPIAYVITLLSGLSWEEVATGLITLSGALVIIGVAGLAGAAVAPGLIALSGALLIFSAALIGLGAGLVIFMSSLVMALDLLGVLMGSLGNLTDFIDLGKNLIGGFIQGVIDGFGSLISKVKEVGAGVLDGIKEVLGIHSPSTEMAKLGLYTDQGFALGLKTGSSQIDSAINSVFGSITDKIDVSSLVGTGENASGNFATGLKRKERDLSTEFGSLIGNANKSIDLTGFNQTGESASNELLSGLTSNLDIESALSSIMGDANTNIDLSAFGLTGENAISEFTSGLQLGGTDISSMFGNMLGTDALSGVDLSSFYSTGEESSNQFLQGLSTASTTKASASATEVAKALCDEIVKAMNSQDLSPSGKKLIEGLVKVLSSGAKDVQKVSAEIGINLTSGIGTGITQKQATVINTVRTLVSGMTTTIKSGLPAMTFNAIGQNAVQGMIAGINVKKALTLTTVKNLCTSITTQFRTSLVQSTFTTYGQNTIQWIINGMNAKKSTALSIVKTICTSISTQFRNGFVSSTFSAHGQNMVQWITNGMNAKKSTATNAAYQIANAITNAFRSNLTQGAFFDIGANAASGLANGIRSQIDGIANSAANAAAQAINAARSKLRIKSPSRVMMEVGEYFSLGLAEGIANEVRSIVEASEKVTDEAINPVKAAVDTMTQLLNDGDFDLDPVIRPVVDLSDVQNGAKEIASLMNQTYDLSSLRDLALGASATFRRNQIVKSAEESANQEGTITEKFEFIQNNYSPKALSRSDIYRQTNNQFSAFRRAVSSK